MKRILNRDINHDLAAELIEAHDLENGYSIRFYNPETRKTGQKSMRTGAAMFGWDLVNRDSDGYVNLKAMSRAEAVTLWMKLIAQVEALHGNAS